MVAGIYFEPNEFVKEAVKRGHPGDLFEGGSASMRLAIEAHGRLSSSEIAQHRARFFRKWVARAKELEPKEGLLHSRMPEHRRRVLKGKRTLALGEMLEELGYRDSQVAQDLANGFPLIGHVGDCEASPASFQPASLTVQDLGSAAPAANASILRTTRGTNDAWVDQELWRKTCEEVGKGWLSKVDPEDVISSGRLSRRFAVVQSGKVRCPLHR